MKRQDITKEGLMTIIANELQLHPMAVASSVSIDSLCRREYSARTGPFKKEGWAGHDPVSELDAKLVLAVMAIEDTYELTISDEEIPRVIGQNYDSLVNYLQGKL